MVKKAPEEVPESVAKRLKREEERKTKLTHLEQSESQRLETLKQEYKKRFRQHQDLYERMQTEQQRALAEAQKNGDLLVPPEQKVAFVIRLRGIRQNAPKPRKILQLLRLKQVHNGVFIRLNATSIQMLQRVSPFIVYGYPSLETIRQLIYKRGYTTWEKKKVPINDNRVVERALSKHDIICVEDLVKEIYTCGPNFKQANSFLRSFHLSAPKGGFRAKKVSYVNGGDWGNRESLIDQLINRMI